MPTYKISNIITSDLDLFRGLDPDLYLIPVDADKHDICSFSIAAWMKDKRQLFADAPGDY